ncbi:MAG: hypothetical protein KUG77_20130 [Nannocystaceae bacterium]|nr:hypothetical protein [Nannocystaceae bacterium]
MTRSRDPIASTTIARLYLAQGHRRKAGRMLDALINSNPADGSALHLRERLDRTEMPTLTAAVDDTHLEITWEGVREAPRRHVVVVSYLGAATLPRIQATSVACEEAAGECTFARPKEPGSAAVCIGFIGPGGFVAEAVTSPLVWSSEPPDSQA